MCKGRRVARILKWGGQPWILSKQGPRSGRYFFVKLKMVPFESILNLKWGGHSPIPPSLSNCPLALISNSLLVGIKVGRVGIKEGPAGLKVGPAGNKVGRAGIKVGRTGINVGTIC